MRTKIKTFIDLDKQPAKDDYIIKDNFSQALIYINISVTEVFLSCGHTNRYNLVYCLLPVNAKHTPPFKYHNWSGLTPGNQPLHDFSYTTDGPK